MKEGAGGNSFHTVKSKKKRVRPPSFPSSSLCTPSILHPHLPPHSIPYSIPSFSVPHSLFLFISLSCPHFLSSHPPISLHSFNPYRPAVALRTALITTHLVLLKAVANTTLSEFSVDALMDPHVESDYRETAMSTNSLFLQTQLWAIDLFPPCKLALPRK